MGENHDIWMGLVLGGRIACKMKLEEVLREDEEKCRMEGISYIYLLDDYM